jgi:hypothetical protein
MIKARGHFATDEAAGKLKMLRCGRRYIRRNERPTLDMQNLQDTFGISRAVAGSEAASGLEERIGPELFQAGAESRPLMQGTRANTRRASTRGHPVAFRCGFNSPMIASLLKPPIFQE